MKHYTYVEWLQYVKNEMNENIREELESHLYTCDECLDHYLQAMATNESSLPILSNEDSFTGLVMAEVSKQKVEKARDKNPVFLAAATVPKEQINQPKTNTKKPFYQQAAFHYLLAAVATILLTFTGVFQSLAAYANSLESPQIQEKRPSVTEGVMNKTFAWMDSLEKKEAKKK